MLGPPGVHDRLVGSAREWGGFCFVSLLSSPECSRSRCPCPTVWAQMLTTLVLLPVTAASAFFGCKTGSELLTSTKDLISSAEGSLVSSTAALVEGVEEDGGDGQPKAALNRAARRRARRQRYLARVRAKAAHATKSIARSHSKLPHPAHVSASSGSSRSGSPRRSPSRSPTASRSPSRSPSSSPGKHRVVSICDPNISPNARKMAVATVVSTVVPAMRVAPNRWPDELGAGPPKQSLHPRAHHCVARDRAEQAGLPPHEPHSSAPVVWAYPPRDGQIEPDRRWQQWQQGALQQWQQGALQQWQRGAPLPEGLATAASTSTPPPVEGFRPHSPFWRQPHRRRPPPPTPPAAETVCPPVVPPSQTETAQVAGSSRPYSPLWRRRRPPPPTPPAAQSANVRSGSEGIRPVTPCDRPSTAWFDAPTTLTDCHQLYDHQSHQHPNAAPVCYDLHSHAIDRTAAAPAPPEGATRWPSPDAGGSRGRMLAFCSRPLTPRLHTARESTSRGGGTRRAPVSRAGDAPAARVSAASSSPGARPGDALLQASTPSAVDRPSTTASVWGERPLPPNATDCQAAREKAAAAREKAAAARERAAAARERVAAARAAAVMQMQRRQLQEKGRIAEQGQELRRQQQEELRRQQQQQRLEGAGFCSDCTGCTTVVTAFADAAEAAPLALELLPMRSDSPTNSLTSSSER